MHGIPAPRGAHPCGSDTAAHTAAQVHDAAAAEGSAWRLVQAAARAVGSFDPGRPARFRLASDARLVVLGGHEETADLLWEPAQGWHCALGASDPRRELAELYLPIASAGAHRALTIGHLGQSLDGFIATASGDSCFVTGPQNILHLHRLRALCDAVIVGAGTVDADNPQLTTRLVAGSNPARVILDPACRLPASHAVFHDGKAVTLRVCAAGNAAGDDSQAVPAGAHAGAEMRLEIDAPGGALDLAGLLQELHARGYFRVLIEGGGVTVSSFLQAGLLDRLHIAIAPILIGEGRPAIRLAPRPYLRDCLRPQHRVYRTGSDILYDCDLRAGAAPAAAAAAVTAATPAAERIL